MQLPHFKSVGAKAGWGGGTALLHRSSASGSSGGERVLVMFIFRFSSSFVVQLEAELVCDRS